MKTRLCALLMLVPIMSWAEDAVLADVLARIHEVGPSKYQYQETRQMELLDAPVQAQGYMLTDAEGTLIKLQIQPNRVIMAIAGQSMFYWDPAQNQRHSASLAYGGSAAQQITVFRSILQGRIEELQAAYDLAAESKEGQWTLRLTAKPDRTDSAASSVVISGDKQDKQRKIVLQQADGESTEYLIAKVADDQAQESTIGSLLREVTGD